MILDFYHAAELPYLGKIAQAWHSTDTEAVKTWMEPWCHDLKHKGGEFVLGRLRDLRGSRGVPKAVRVRVEKEAITISKTRSIEWITRVIKPREWQIGPVPWNRPAKQ